VEGDKVSKYRFPPRRLVAVAGLFVLLGAGCSAKPDPVCEQFMQLKNAQDPAADDLLGPLPQVPTNPVTDEEADRLDAEFILHSPLWIAAARPETVANGEPARCVLVVKGTFSCRSLLIQGGQGLSQRHLVNPDVIVEIRDGKIYGVRARMHSD
jgi:hypothetical protein